MPVIGGSLLVGSSNLYDLGASASRMRKLWSTDGDFSGALTVATKPLVSSPTAGNALTWDSTGLYVAAGAIPANPQLVDPTVRDTILWGAKPAGVADMSLWRQSSSTMTLAASPQAWFRVWMGSGTSAWLGQAVPGISTSARLDLAANLYYDGSAWTREVTTSPAALLSFLPTAANVQSCLVGMWDVPEGGGAAVITERFNLTRSGNLGLGETNGIGGIPINVANRVIKLGGTGIFEANGTRTYVSIADNYFFSGAGAGRTITTNVSSYLQQADGALTFSNAPAAAPGATVTQTARLTISTLGTASFFSDGANVAIDAYNNIRVRAGPSALAGVWYASADGADRAFVGLEGASTTVWRIYSPPVGNILNINLTTGAAAWSGTMSCGNLTISNTLNSASQLYLTASGGGNIQVSPGGGYMHPDGDNTRIFGHPGIRWQNGYFVTATITTLSAAAQMNINPGFHLVCQTAGGGWIYLRSTGHSFFDGSVGAIVAPEIDNKLICGGTGNRWQYIAAVQGGINTCFAHEKEIVGEVDPEAALDALLKTPLVLFHPKDCDGNVNEDMLFAGPVNTTVDKRLQIGEGALTAAGHQAAYAMASIQALHKYIVELRAEIATLREAISA